MFSRVYEWLFGRTKTVSRSPESVDLAIEGCQSAEAIGRLVTFGAGLLKANDDRAATIDSKSTAIIGYTTAIMAFLVTRDFPWLTMPWLKAALMATAGLCAFGGSVSAALAVRAARDWKAMGDATWFPLDAQTIRDAVQLDRWYLRAMHQSFVDNHAIVNAKAHELIQAQVLTAGASILLTLSFLVEPVTAIVFRLAALLHSV